MGILMANKAKYTPKTILDIKFEKNVKGYNANEVDETLDQIIEDYEYFEKELADAKEYITRLETEDRKLKQELESLKIEYTKIKAKLDRIGDTNGVTKENLDYIVRIRQLERYIYSLGHDPKKIK